MGFLSLSVFIIAIAKVPWSHAFPKPLPLVTVLKSTLTSDPNSPGNMSCNFSVPSSPALLYLLITHYIWSHFLLSKQSSPPTPTLPPQQSLKLPEEECGILSCFVESQQPYKRQELMFIKSSSWDDTYRLGSSVRINHFWWTVSRVMTFQSECFLKLGKERKQGESPVGGWEGHAQNGTFLGVCIINSAEVKCFRKKKKIPSGSYDKSDQLCTHHQKHKTSGLTIQQQCVGFVFSLWDHLSFIIKSSRNFRHIVSSKFFVSWPWPYVWKYARPYTVFHSVSNNWSSQSTGEKRKGRAPFPLLLASN